MIAALFDMDNTLLSLDTGTSYTKFLYTRGELSKRMVARVLYWSALYKLAVLDMESLFVRLCADLVGDSEADMLAKCAIWYREHLASSVAPGARLALDLHRGAGHVVALATGSTVYAARPVAHGVGITHVLASDMEVVGGAFTGRPGTMCFGRHKVTLVEDWARRHDVDLAQSYFYSDSFNDLPLLSRVGFPIVVNPDTRLKRHAHKHSWPIQHWR